VGYLGDRFSGMPEVERLGGMSGGEVARLRFPDTSVIVKRSPTPVETHVYTMLSRTFSAHHIAIPRLFWSGQDEDDY
jgi:hypothetical protein